MYDTLFTDELVILTDSLKQTVFFEILKFETGDCEKALNPEHTARAMEIVINMVSLRFNLFFS